MREDNGTTVSSVAEGMMGLLSSEEDTSAIAIFVELCRTAPTLRGWLWQEFAQSESVRSQFAHLLESPTAPESPSTLLTELAGQSRGYTLEKARLKERFAARFNEARHGGLTRLEIENLIRRYQAGRLDGGAFLLAYAWRRQAANGARLSPHLMRASSAFLADATKPGGAGLLADPMLSHQAIEGELIAYSRFDLACISFRK